MPSTLSNTRGHVRRGIRERQNAGARSGSWKAATYHDLAAWDSIAPGDGAGVDVVRQMGFDKPDRLAKSFRPLHLNASHGFHDSAVSALRPVSFCSLWT